MNILGIAVIAVYILALLLRWYQNYWMVLESFDLPRIIRSMTRRTVYMVVTFVLTYGSIVGIWYFYGLWAALFALVVRMIIGRVSFSRYFKRQVMEYAEWEYEQMLKDRANANVPIEKLSGTDMIGRMLRPPTDVNTMDEASMRQEAYQRARAALHHRMMRGGD